jgi:hypothetical protein
MDYETVWWPVAVIVALILAAVMILVFGYGLRRRTAPFGERVAWIAAAVVPLLAAVCFWGYYGFYGFFR